ncbi:MAG TPA: hypothetical protein VD813_12815 [Pseudonocardia sp.]|nr:hypothetical protein [Pseudonocardia sp.]
MPIRPTTPGPDHTWVVRSRHRTSEGTVAYESCSCGLARIRACGWPGPLAVVDLAAPAGFVTHGGVSDR